MVVHSSKTLPPDKKGNKKFERKSFCLFFLGVHILFSQQIGTLSLPGSIYRDLLLRLNLAVREAAIVSWKYKSSTHRMAALLRQGRPLKVSKRTFMDAHFCILLMTLQGIKVSFLFLPFPFCFLISLYFLFPPRISIYLFKTSI